LFGPSVNDVTRSEELNSEMNVDKSRVDIIKIYFLTFLKDA